MPARLTLPLAGAGGEPVDVRATIGSHGLVRLAPGRVAPDGRSLTTTLDTGAHAHRVTLGESAGELAVEVHGAPPAADVEAALVRQVRTMFALDLDLSNYYARAARDPSLAWTTRGIGRMLRAPTAFEDVVRTLCTTNCTWSATTRMLEALVGALGRPAHGLTAAADEPAWFGRAFPSAAALAAADPRIFGEIARMGYRGAYLSAFATSVASGEVDVEALRAASPAELPDAELERELLALPGIGPYAAAHTMLLFGRRSRLVFDSWTRPSYAKLVRRKTVTDAAIERRFRRAYGEDAGLAFWLFLWRERHESAAVAGQGDPLPGA